LKAVSLCFYLVFVNLILHKRQLSLLFQLLTCFCYLMNHAKFTLNCLDVNPFLFGDYP